MKESNTIEFKKSTSELKQAIISLSSMLNKSSEGTLYFGILNDGKIVGQTIGKDTTRDISIAIRNYIKPFVNSNISIEKKNKKEIIKVTVKGNDKPYSAYGRYYMRSDDEDVLMDTLQLEKLFVNKAIDYSNWETTSTDYSLDCIDEELLIKYMSEAHECGRISEIYKDVETSLTKLGLYKNSKLNNAGYYLFSKNKPLTIKLANFPNDSRDVFSDIKSFKGNIFECIEQAYNYILNNIHWSATIPGLQRQEKPEIPTNAIREIVVNSFAHMKIENSKSIQNQIQISKSKIHISNPGSIINNINPTKFASGEKPPVLRNPLIGNVLYRNNTIDSFGTGFERVFNACDKENIKYQYFNDDLSFTFEFLRKNNVDMISDNMFVYEANNESNETKIINLIKKDCHITKNELAIQLGVSVPTISRNIDNLVRIGSISRIGARKNGFWKINN